MKPVLILLPGASGSFTKSMVDCLIPKLELTFNVRTRPGKWKGWNPNSNENVHSVLKLCPKDGIYYILGNSFGNHVLCSMIVNNSFAKADAFPPSKIILCGYPMYNDKCTNERVDLIKSLPKNTKVLCISGSNDNFLKHNGSKQGKSLYETIISTMLCKDTTELHIVENGGHGVIDVKKSEMNIIVNKVFKWITDFIQ